MKTHPLLCFVAFCTSFFCVAEVFAQVPPRTTKRYRHVTRLENYDDKDAHKMLERADSAATVLREMMEASDRDLPKAMIERATCVAVFPSVKKGGFAVGGQWGRGVVSCRQDKGWSTPAFLNLSGGSFGLQIGLEMTDLIVIINSRSGLGSLLKSRTQLGADASVTAGVFGRGAGVSTDAFMRAGIITFSRNRGLFAGLELKGAMISADNKANQIVYGTRHVHELLATDTIQDSDRAIRVYTKALQDISPVKAVYGRIREVAKPPTPSS